MRRSLIINFLLAVLTLSVVVGAFTSFQRKRSSFEQLDFRFERTNGVISVTRVEPVSAAAQAGLRPGDRILLMGETPSTQVGGVKSTLRKSGRPVPMLVEREGRTFTVTYRAPEPRIDYPYLILSFIGFLYLAIGLFTLSKGETGESRLFYFVTLLSFIVYVYTPAGDIDWSYKLLHTVEEMARIFLPPLALHFFVRFPRPLLRDRRWIALMYLPPVLLALWNINLLTFGNAIPIADPRTSLQIIDRWEMFDFGLYFTLAVAALAFTYRDAAAVGKKQIKWIYLGLALGFLPFLGIYLIPYLLTGNVRPIFSTISILPLAFIPLAFAVSILRYKLWDVEVVIKEVLAYSVTVAFGIVAFSTINLILSRVIEDRSAMERNFLAFTSGLVIAGVLIPVKGRIEAAIEMVLYRDSYKHRRTMADFAQELATFHDVHELIANVRDRLRTTLDLERMNLFTREGTSLLIYESEPGVPRRAAAADFGPIPSDGPMMLTRPRLPDASELPWQLLSAGYRYMFPLRHRGELQGLLILGSRRGDEPLSRDDLHLVGTLTAPLALAIENSRLYGKLRRQLEEIRALKEYNENIIESSHSAIAVVAEDGLVLTANRAFWDLVGTDHTHESITDLFPPYEELRAGNGPTLTTHFVNALGVEKEVTVTASPLTAGAETHSAQVLVIGDISDRVRMERELQDKERLASLGLLAAGVAHEVNTPLTGISSYAQLLLADTSPDDPRYRLLQKMEQQTFRASNLVNSLLDLIASRPRTREIVDVAELIRSTVALHSELFEARRVQVHLDRIEPLPVHGNAGDLQQVLTNVLLNARDAVAEGGNVWITGEASGRQAIIRIRDDGTGIAHELLGRIFDPLVTTKRGQGGTGLGLAITRRILSACNGEISATNVPGAGAEFSISLPLISTGSGILTESIPGTTRI